MAHQKTFYQISRVVITGIRYGIFNSSDFSHCEVVVGSQKWRSSKQEEENGAANGPQVWAVIAIRKEGGRRVRNLPFWIYFDFGEYLW